jgi:hypothetical protein
MESIDFNHFFGSIKSTDKTQLSHRAGMRAREIIQS